MIRVINTIVVFSMGKTYRPRPANDPLNAKSFSFHPVVRAANLSDTGEIRGVVTSDDGREFDLGTVATEDWLLPGQTEELQVPFWVPEGPEITSILVSASVDSDRMGGEQYNECDEQNNAADSNPMSCPSVQ